MVLFWPFGDSIARHFRALNYASPAWSLTMTAQSTHISGYAFLTLLAQGFIGASLLHRWDLPSNSSYSCLTHKQFRREILIPQPKKNLPRSQFLHSFSGGGCIWNDNIEWVVWALWSPWRNECIPKERTKTRPIAAGRISVSGALVFLFVHLVLLVGIIWPTDAPMWGYFPRVDLRLSKVTRTSQLEAWAYIYISPPGYIPPYEAYHILAPSLAR